MSNQDNGAAMDQNFAICIMNFTPQEHATKTPHLH